MQNTKSGRASTADLEVVLGRLSSASREGEAGPVRVADLARVAGVSVRSVYRASARHLGEPPMTHLRRSRLHEVRRRLLEAAPGETVTSAAMDAGFFHLGRFSALYRRHFLESPSATLRRARVREFSTLTARGGPGTGPGEPAAALEG